MKAEVKKITPEMATEWLKRNKSNRHLSERHINLYEDQMRAGKWMLTGSPIMFDDKNNLLDGQHRLNAVVRFGKPVEFLVCEGLSPDTFKVIDTGKNRSAGDVLSVKGITNPTRTAAIAISIILFRNGYFSQNSGEGRRKSYATNSDVLKFVQDQSGFDEIVQYASEIVRNFRFVPLSTIGCLYFILSKKNQTKADQFFEKYAKGIDLSEQSSVRVLRDRLIRDSQNKTKLSGRDKMALIIMAWNNFLTNKKTQQLKLANNYNFPKPL